MNEKEIAESAYSAWKARDLKGSKSEVIALLKSMVSEVVDKVIVTSPNFTFVTNVHTYTVVSGDTNTLELFGNNSDARAVYTVLWGTSHKYLPKYSEFEYDVLLSNTTVSGTPFGWVDRGYGSSGYPKIEIIGDAVTAGDVVKYRYLRNDVTIQEFPERWAFVVRDAVLAQARPDIFRFVAKDSMQKMLDFFTPPPKAGESSFPDPNIASSNYKRATDLNVG